MFSVQIQQSYVNSNEVKYDIIFVLHKQQKTGLSNVLERFYTP